MKVTSGGYCADMKLAVHFINFNLPGGTAAIAPTIAATAQAVARRRMMIREVRFWSAGKAMMLRRCFP